MKANTAIFGKCLNYKSGLRIWPNFNFVDFRAYFAHFSLVKSAKNKIAFLQRKECSNKKNEENKSGLEFNLPSKSKCASLNFEIWAFVANPTEPYSAVYYYTVLFITLFCCIAFMLLVVKLIYAYKRKLCCFEISFKKLSSCRHVWWDRNLFSDLGTNVPIPPFISRWGN